MTISHWPQFWNSCLLPYLYLEYQNWVFKQKIYFGKKYCFNYKKSFPSIFWKNVMLRIFETHMFWLLFITRVKVKKEIYSNSWPWPFFWDNNWFLYRALTCHQNILFIYMDLVKFVMCTLIFSVHMTFYIPRKG